MNTNHTCRRGLSRAFSTALVLILVFTLVGAPNQPARAAYQQQEEGPQTWHASLSDLKGGQEGPVAQAVSQPEMAGGSSSLIAFVQDVTIDEGRPNVSDWDCIAEDGGGYPYCLRAGYYGYKRQRFLVKPLLSGLPPNAVISSATLSLALGGWFEYSDTTYQTITFRRVTEPWHPNLATWNNQPAVGEVVQTMRVGRDQTITWYSMNVTSLVKAWYAGTVPNYGLMAFGPEGGRDVYRTFASNDTIYPPKLTITYTSPAPALSATPVAFVTDGSTVPLAQKAIQITNTGSLTANWTVSNKPSWLTLGSMSGVVGPYSTISIPAWGSISGMSPNTTLSGTVQITSTTEGVAPASPAVSVTYLAPPAKRQFMPMLAKNAAPSSSSGAPGMVAVLVGINDYEHMISPSPTAFSIARQVDKNTDLKHAKDDVYNFTAILDWANDTGSAASIGLSGAPPGDGQASAELLQSAMLAAGNIQIITRVDAQASKQGILQALAEARELAGPTTRVLFYFSGHAGMHEGNLLIVPQDANPASPDINVYLTDTELDAQLDQFAGQSIVFLDTCQSGGAIPNLAQSGRLVMTATEADQSSYERSDLSQGVFTYFMEMGFLATAADTNHDSYVSFEEAFDYADERVTGMYNTQVPQISDGIPGSVNLTRP